ncbi:MAG: hypothetical protein CVT68_04060, partial [Actinobacteria bacterium HGW-Actinobacteria-8]
PSPPPDDPGGDGPPPEDQKDEVEVVCVCKGGLAITSPAEKEKTIQSGKSVAFAATCEESASNESIKWKVTKVSGAGTAQPASGNGAGLTVAFASNDTGKFSVVASCDTDECDGSDTRTIIVSKCATAGAVRVCGKTIDETTTGKFTVTGDVTIGMGSGEQFLRVSTPVQVDSDAKQVTGDGRWSMATRIGYLKTFDDLPIYNGGFQINGTSGDITLVAPPVDKDSDARSLLKVAGFQWLYGGNAKLSMDGVFFALPKISLSNKRYPTQSCGNSDVSGQNPFLPCPDDQLNGTVKQERSLQVEVTGVKIGTDGIEVDGKIEVNNEVRVGAGLKLVKLLLEWNSAKEAFKGEVAVQFGPPAAATKIALSGSIEKGVLKEIAGEITPPKPFPFPGLPGVLVKSLGGSLTDPGYFLSGEGNPGVSFNLGFSYGPTFGIPSPSGGLKELSFASGKVKFSGTMAPVTLTLEGEMGLAADITYEPRGYKTVDEGSLVDGFAKATAKIDWTWSKISATGDFTVKNPIFTDDDLYKGTFGFITQIIAGGDVLVTGRLTGNISLPKLDITVGGVALAGIPAFSLGAGDAGFKLSSASGSPFFAWGTTSFSVPNPNIFTGQPIGLDAKVTFRAGRGLDVYICDRRNHCANLVEATPSATRSASGALPFFAWASGPLAVGAPVRGSYEGVDPEIEVPAGADSLTFGVDHVGELRFDIALPSGVVIGFSAPATTPADGDAFYIGGFPPGRASWTVPNPAPGTYRLTNFSDPDAAREVFASISAPPPALAFDEPFESTGDGVTVAWALDEPADGGEISLSYGPTRDRAGAIAFASVPLDGPASVVWDTSNVAPGAYFIFADVFDASDRVVRIASRSVVCVGRAVADNALAPSLVRVAGDGDAAEVTWLAGDGADYHTVAASPVGRPDLAPVTATAQGGATQATLSGLDPDVAYVIAVTATRESDGAQAASAGVSFGGSGAQFVTEPPVALMVDEEWFYAPLVVDAGADPQAAFVLTGAPPEMVFDTAAGGYFFTPEPSHVGQRYDVVLQWVSGLGVVRAEQRFTLSIGGERAARSPELVTRPEGVGVIGEAWTWPLEGRAYFGQPSFALVAGPAGASLDPDGVVRWTPTAGEVIDARGEVAVVVEVRDELGLATEVGAVVSFADADGDGLTTAWELASGLDPFAPDDSGADPDGDGLDQLAEQARGTRGDRSDSDGDGLADGAETTTSPRSGDSDGDGIDDGTELTAGTDAMAADSDGDGVPDAEEIARGLDPSDATDSDGDGLADDLEVTLNSDPALADTDGDGCDDATERTLGTDPRATDSDGDGAADCAEVAAGSDPLRSAGDSDRDGLSDDLERTLGTNPFNEDSDGDGFDDGLEVSLDTDPLRDLSKPDIGEVPRPDVPIIMVGVSGKQVLPGGEVVDVGDILILRDDDLDGADDPYERLHGYDPGDPEDGASDDDGDGLPLWWESRLGTDPRAADSDGDGVPDGQELVDGTDPTDPQDFAEGGPVVSLTSRPGQLVLRSHSMLGPARAPLTIIGARADGSLVDVTAGARGTTYTIEPTAAGVVSADGVVTAQLGYEGPLSVTASNLGESVTASGSVSIFAPTTVATVRLPGYPGRIALAGDRLAVAQGKNVHVIDVRVRTSPILGAALPLGFSVVGVDLEGTLAIAALGSGGVALADVSDIEEPRLLARIDVGASVAAAAIGDDGRLYLATSAGLRVVDPARPELPKVERAGALVDGRVIAVYEPDLAFTHIDRHHDRLAAAFGTSGDVILFQILAVGTVVELDRGTVGALIYDLALQGTNVFAGNLNNGIRRLGLGPTAAPLVIGSSTFFVERLALAGPYVLASNRTTTPVSASLLIGDQPDDIILKGNLEHHMDAQGMAADSVYYYISGARDGGVVDIARYLAPNDLLGVPPVVSAVTPAPGSEILEGADLRFEVDAQDDVAVVGLTLTIDGVEAAQFVETATPPYVATTRAPAVDVPQELLLGASAVDLGGNVGELEPYPISVVPVVDLEPPSVALVEPLDQEYVADGGTLNVRVNAFDNHAVRRVTLYIDDVEAGVDDAPPWAFTVQLPESAPDDTVSVRVVALDYGDNTASATSRVLLSGVDLVAEGVEVISAADGTWDGQRVLVKGGTVAIDGPHAFDVLRVGRGGVLAHSETTASAVYGLDVSAEEIGVHQLGAIDVTGRGYLGDCAVGDPSCSNGAHSDGNTDGGAKRFTGGSHGGVGGGAEADTAPTYDAFDAPTQPGGGGGYGNSGNWPGGDGGGVMALSAATLVLNGAIRADGGVPPIAATQAGGGAGGSVRITVDAIRGGGRITANGGVTAR